MRKPPRLSIVTVTYGRRAHLLERTISALAQSRELIDAIIIVNNLGEIDKTSKTLEQFIEKPIILDLKRNTGSANGFAVGIDRALQEKSDYILLLDDDNLLLEGSIERLIEIISSARDPIHTVLTCLRRGRREYADAAEQGKYGVPENAFLGFSLLSKSRDILWNRKQSKAGKKLLVPLPSAPYGGTLFHRQLALDVGLPDKDFFLYFDDKDYFLRAKEVGFDVLLVTEAQIEDIDTSWNRVMRREGHYLTSKFTSEEKVYYVVRNSVFLANKYKEKGILFWINAVTLISISAIKTIMREGNILATAKRLKLISTAIKAGKGRDLGEWRKN